MPAEPKLTRWFEWPTRPTLEGWYDVRRGGSRRIQRLWWNGGGFCSDPRDTLGGEFGFCHGDQWRGLAAPPKEQGNAN